MKLLDLKQGSREWLDWRQWGLGGSDMGSIMLGDDWPYKESRHDALLSMKIEFRNLEANNAMKRGHWMEGPARMGWCSLHHGMTADPVCVQHDDVDWMRVSLDGLAKFEDGLKVILEIKCPSWQQHNLAHAGIVPAHYVPQVQYQLMVTGLDLLHYVSATDSGRFGATKDELDIAIVEVRPDPELQAEILERGTEFWQKVLAGRKAMWGDRRRA